VVAVVQQQPLVRELVQLDARPSGERMRGRQERDDAFVVERGALQLARVAGQAEQADVDTSLPQRFHLVPARHVVAEDGDAGGARFVAGANPVDGVPEPPADAEADDAAAVRLHGLHVIGELGGGGGEAHRLIEHQRALMRQLDAVAAAEKQGEPQLLFELLHLAGDRGLRHTQTAARAAETQFLGDGDKRLDVPNFHISPIRRTVS